MLWLFLLEENVLAKIPQVLHQHINTAYPANVCLIGTVLPNGFAQITPRGSTMVFDDEHIALWERGRGTTTENLTDGTPVTIFMRKPALRGGRHRRHPAALRLGEDPQVWTGL